MNAGTHAHEQDGISLPYPQKDDSPETWQAAYRQYLQHYRQMVKTMPGETADYRTEKNAEEWAHKMVDASLGAVWWRAFFGVVEADDINRGWRDIREHAKTGEQKS